MASASQLSVQFISADPIFSFSILPPKFCPPAVSPHLTSHHFTSPHLTSPHLASHRITSLRSIPTIVRTVGSGLQVHSVSTPLMGQATTTCSVSAILVMYGLPRLLTGCVIAHELMHAWLRMRNVAQLDAQVEEGMCQLMAMLWLDGQNDSLAVSGFRTNCLLF